MLPERCNGVAWLCVACMRHRVCSLGLALRWLTRCGQQQTTLVARRRRLRREEGLRGCRVRSQTEDRRRDAADAIRTNLSGYEHRFRKIAVKTLAVRIACQDRIKFRDVTR